MPKCNLTQSLKARIFGSFGNLDRSSAKVTQGISQFRRMDTQLTDNPVAWLLCLAIIFRGIIKKNFSR
jgi:hypothetical protein